MKRECMAGLSHVTVGTPTVRPYNRPDSGLSSVSESGPDAEISPLARGPSDLHSWCVRVFGADGVALLPVRIQSDGAGRGRCGLYRARGLSRRAGRLRALSRVSGQDRHRTRARAAIALWHVRGSVRGRLPPCGVEVLPGRARRAVTDQLGATCQSWMRTSEARSIRGFVLS